MSFDNNADLISLADNHSFDENTAKSSSSYFDWSTCTLQQDKLSLNKKADEKINQLLSNDTKETVDEGLKGWYGMKAVELTPELKTDIKLLQMRNSLDPKRFYKKENILTSKETKSKEKEKYYFQIGTIQESAFDRFNRLSNKERKGTIVDQLLKDQKLQEWYKKKFNEVQERKEINRRKNRSFVSKKRKPWKK